MSEQNKQIVFRFNREFIERNDATSLDDLVSDSFVNHTAPPGTPPGKEGLLAFMAVFHRAFTNVQVHIYDQVAESDKVVTRKEIQGTHIGDFMGISATGKTVRLPVMDIIRLENGKYAEHWAVRDTAAILQQLTSK